jgi:GT2 family glycosyltransferase
MDERVSIAVIIPAYGPTPYLRAILERIESGARHPQEIIVSHSGSHDPTETLAKKYPQVRVLHSQARLFAGAARNRGAAVAESDLLAFCDSDVLPAADWLERLAGALEAGERRFVVGSVGTARIGGYWGRANWLCEFSEQAPWRPGGEQNGGASCNMAVLRTDFAAIGGFPVDAHVSEDTQLFAKLRAAGLRQLFVPSAEVGHYNLSGIGNLARHQRLHGRHFAEPRRRLELPGSSIVRRPWLAPLLPAAKGCRIVRRLLEGGGREKRWALAYLPGIIVGMAFWGFGLVQGVFWTRRG